MKNTNLVNKILSDSGNWVVKGDIKTGVTSVLKEIIVDAQLSSAYSRIVAVSEEHGFRSIGLYNGVSKYVDACNGIDAVTYTAIEKKKVMLVLDDVDVAVKSSLVADKLLPLIKSGMCKVVVGMHNNYVDAPVYNGICNYSHLVWLREETPGTVTYAVNDMYGTLQRVDFDNV